MSQSNNLTAFRPSSRNTEWDSFCTIISQSRRVQQAINDQIRTEIDLIKRELYTLYNIDSDTIDEFFKYQNNPQIDPKPYLSAFILIAKHFKIQELYERLTSILKNDFSKATDDALIDSLKYQSQQDQNPKITSFDSFNVTDQELIKIERFNRILSNPKFAELDPSIVYRLLNKIAASGKITEISNDDLYKYIQCHQKSAYFLFQFVDINKFSHQTLQSFLSTIQLEKNSELLSFLNCPVDLLINPNNEIKQLMKDKEEMQKVIAQQNAEIEKLEKQYNNIKNKYLQKVFNRYDITTNSDFSLHGFLTQEDRNNISKEDMRSLFDLFSFEQERGNLTATSNIAYIYENGIGVNKDPVKAKQLYNEVSQGNNENSLFYLGYSYENKSGQSSDIQQAISYYKQASDKGHIDATYRLALCQLKCNHPNLYKAILAYRKESQYGNLEKAASEAAREINDKIEFVNHASFFNDSVQLLCPTNIPQIIDLYRKAADNDHLNASYELAVCYELGIGGELKLFEAIHFYRMASEAGDNIATANLGYFYQTGLGVGIDLSKAYELYHHAYQNGNSTIESYLSLCSQDLQQISINLQQHFNELSKNPQPNSEINYELAICYEYGYGTEKNTDRAIAFYSAASKSGNSKAMNNLAYHYAKTNSNETVQLLNKASQQGNISATYNLGYCYDQGLGIMKQSEKALSLYQQASDAGNFDATYNLAFLNRFSFETVIPLLQKASKKNINAINSLAYYYEHSNDLKLAITLYIKACELGNSDAKVNLGYCYEHGIEVEKSYSKAAKLYTEASADGNLDAMCYLAHCYLYGLGVPQLQIKARQLFEQAADQGNPTALNILALFYKKGRCMIEKDIKKAVQYYTKAADLGNPNAAFNLGACYIKGKGVKEDEAKGAQLYQKAADCDHTEAQHALGSCYLMGLGVETDINKAMELFEKAAQKGYLTAAENLASSYSDGFFVPKDEAKARKWEKIVKEIEEKNNNDKRDSVERQIDDLLERARTQFKPSQLTLESGISYWEQYSKKK